MKSKIKAAIAILTIGLIGLSACDDQKGSNTQNKETDIATEQQDQFLQAQPIPSYNWSQLRQNLIEIETAQANTTATTSFMFLLAGVGESGPMVHSCPSIGFPIPATYQLTNPEKPLKINLSGGGVANDVVTVSQLEPTGVYTGDTTGTYVMCVDSNGKAYAFYHEGYVSTVSWDTVKGEIVMDGASSADFTVGK